MIYKPHNYQKYATEFKYHKAHEDKRKAKGRIDMHFISSDTDENYYFVEYGKTNTYNYKKNGGAIEFRYRFSHPRLDVYLPNKKGFASLEFSDYDEETKETPSVTINVVNNEELEKAMYESKGE